MKRMRSFEVKGNNTKPAAKKKKKKKTHVCLYTNLLILFTVNHMQFLAGKISIMFTEFISLDSNYCMIRSASYLSDM